MHRCSFVLPSQTVPFVGVSNLVIVLLYCCITLVCYVVVCSIESAQVTGSQTRAWLPDVWYCLKTVSLIKNPKRDNFL